MKIQDEKLNIEDYKIRITHDNLIKLVDCGIGDYLGIQIYSLEQLELIVAWARNLIINGSDYE